MFTRENFIRRIFVKLYYLKYKKIRYVIKSGDRLFEIARAFHSTVGDIMMYNRIKRCGVIFVGVLIKIPVRRTRALLDAKD